MFAARSIKAKEPVTKPSASEGEIHPSHKSYDLYSVYFALRGRGFVTVRQEGGEVMDRNTYIRLTKLTDAEGRIGYISSTAKQENLYAIYETTERSFWTKLVKENRADFARSGTNGQCIEARELIIALPENFVEYEPNELLRRYTELFKTTYGIECIAALHHNKAMTNYHIHLIFSERKLMDVPEQKIASRNMFYDETGKKCRTKKEILDTKGNIKSGCTVIKKGEVYEEKLFEKKNPLFKQRSFLREVKELYVNEMNKQIPEHVMKMRVFAKDGHIFH